MATGSCCHNTQSQGVLLNDAYKDAKLHHLNRSKSAFFTIPHLEKIIDIDSMHLATLE